MMNRPFFTGGGGEAIRRTHTLWAKTGVLSTGVKGSRDGRRDGAAITRVWIVWYRRLLPEDQLPWKPFTPRRWNRRLDHCSWRRPPRAWLLWNSTPGCRGSKRFVRIRAISG